MNMQEELYPLKLIKKGEKIFTHIRLTQPKDISIGEGYFCVIAGPCAVENFNQTFETAKELKKQGMTLFRAGAFKPRSSPYSFQGLGKKALEILKIVKKEIGVAIVTEALSEEHVEEVAEIAEIIQIGARNMQNFPLLEKVAKTGKTILLKRSPAATIEEFLLSAEYLALRGNENIILCERGIRTFERYTRNTLDISAVPVIKRLSHLPIIVDPSHAVGKSEYIIPLAKAGLSVGADGIMIEVHPDPQNALSDGRQSLDFEGFERLLNELKSLSNFLGKLLF
jgi:3-deoxy-7-phosphoheptulonate synthase